MKQPKRKILFYCEDNATRSLIAEAIFRHLAGSTWEVYSAGKRSGGPHPLMLRVLEEAGVQQNELVSKTLDELPCRAFDLVVTLSGEEKDEELAQIKSDFLIHLPFNDPASQVGVVDSVRAFRQVRDQIFGRLSVLIHRLESEDSDHRKPTPKKWLGPMLGSFILPCH